ncbi:MAG: flagellar motor protein MotB [Hyphomonadaceae bacterium]
MANFSSVRHGRGRGHRRGESRRSGQWKLAYADFLTALMAFFLLMWLSAGTSMTERSAIAALFGASPSEASVPTMTAPALERLLVETLAQKNVSELQAHIGIEPAADGLRINLTDKPGRSLFNTGESHFNEDGMALTLALGDVLAGMPQRIRIEGHTDAFKTAVGTDNNWVISSARANAALTLLSQAGIASNRFSSVAGMADTIPLIPSRPHAPANRRVSIVLELP